MRVFRGADVRLAGRRWMTIGVFDGVHVGHQALMGRVVAQAAAAACAAAAVTFDPNPLEVLRPDVAGPRLTTLDHRVDLMADAGLDEVVVVPFDRHLAAMDARSFAEDFVLGQLGAIGVVVGDNFRFGAAAAGDVGTLRSIAAAHGAEVLDPALIVEGSDPVSSTRIRALVAAGRVREASVMLGRPHCVEGQVVRGARRGRDLGFPTANVETTSRAAVPTDGVYAGWGLVGGRRHPAAISIGTNPTFGEGGRTVEAFLLDVEADLYGQAMRVEFVDRVRDTVRFTSVTDLVDQMHDDVRRVRGLLAAG